MRPWKSIATVSLVLLGVVPLVTVQGNRDAPDQVLAHYDTFCQSCHGNGAADAPVAHDPADWGHRAHLTTDVLVARAKAGRQGMPAKGGCHSCTDADLTALVEFMRTTD